MPSVLIIPEGVESSDGRSYEVGLLTWRDTVPLQFTDETTFAHEGATFAGNISNLRRQTVEGETWIVGDLTYDTDEIALEAERMAAQSKIPGVSADIAQIWEETGTFDEMGFPEFRLAAAEIVGVTQVPMPAFGGARILTAEEETMLPALVAALVSGVETGWFSNPELAGPTPLTVTSDGRVFGHLATWGTCHIAFDETCVSPPKSSYDYFHTGAVVVDGETIPVGHITMNTGHAALSADLRAATSHYDHTGAVAADVCAGEDEYGIWIAGAVREGVDVAALQAASLSGDWRRVNGELEMVAALAVNVPGFPIPRTQTAVAASGQLSLVASGILPNAPKTDMDRLVESVERLGSMLEGFLVTLNGERIDQGRVVVPAEMHDEFIAEARKSYPKLAAVVDAT